MKYIKESNTEGSSKQVSFHLHRKETMIIAVLIATVAFLAVGVEPTTVFTGVMGFLGGNGMQS